MRQSVLTLIADGLQVIRRGHRRGQRDRAPHQDAWRARHSRRSAVRDRLVRRAVAPRARRLRRSHARVERRRRRHQAEGRVPDRHARHHRCRPRQPLRERHPRAGRACRSFSSTTSRPAGCRPTWPSRSSRGWRVACGDNGCALLGGETAEMPGFYADGEYDLAGFIVGAVERERLIDGPQIAPGDVLLGLPSTACTPTAIRWRGGSCSSSSASASTPRGRPRARRSARRCCGRTAPTCRC